MLFQETLTSISVRPAGPNCADHKAFKYQIFLSSMVKYKSSPPIFRGSSGATETSEFERFTQYLESQRKLKSFMANPDELVGRAFYSHRSDLAYQVLEVVSLGVLRVQDLRSKDTVERRTRESLDHKEMSEGAYRDARKKRDLRQRTDKIPFPPKF